MNTSKSSFFNRPYNKIICYIVLIVAAVFLPKIFKLIGSTTFLATEILIYSIFAIGFNLLLGCTGILSFGHAAWYGIASYACVLCQKYFTPDATFLPMLFGIVFTTSVGALVGMLIIKARGIYFSYITIAFGQLVFFIVYRWTSVTNGENGLGGVARNTFLKYINISSENNFYLFVLAVLIFSVVLMKVIIDSPFGKVLAAIRESRTRAIFIGYDVKSYELAAYIISIFYASVAGCLSLFLSKFAFPESLNYTASGEVVIMTLVGGMHSLAGPIIGAFIITFLKDFISSFTDRWMIVLGVIFIFFVLASPEGIMGWIQKSGTKNNPITALFSKKNKKEDRE